MTIALETEGGFFSWILAIKKPKPRLILILLEVYRFYVWVFDWIFDVEEKEHPAPINEDIDIISEFDIYGIGGFSGI